MLFPYQYVSHPLEKLHGWMEHLVTQVWCRNGGRYSVTLLCEDLQAIASEIDPVETNQGSIFDDIRDIDALIQALGQDKRAELVTMFRESTSVADLCGNTQSLTPYSSKELAAWDKKIALKLILFFSSLFKEHITSGPIKRQLGDLKDHVNSFCGTNKEGICPFCGLVDMRDANFKTRDDYDHYLPRHKYPFNAVNFRNLSPMCKVCNSSYKGSKDPISRASGSRQKAYSPYEALVHFPRVKVTLDAAKIEDLTPTDIELSFESATHQEEVDTWQWLFGIQERYKGKLCQNRGARLWLKMVLKDSAHYGVQPLQALQRIRDMAQDDPFLDDGFLKAATLEACLDKGLIPQN